MIKNHISIELHGNIWVYEYKDKFWGQSLHLWFFTNMLTVGKSLNLSLLIYH